MARTSVRATRARPRGYTDRYWREQALLLLGASGGAARTAADTFELYAKLKRALLKRKGQMRTAGVSSD